jgi:hypothetical protein
VEINPAKPNTGSGIGLKLFGFIPEPVFTFIPDHCSESSRIGVLDHPGIAFTLPRNPHVVRASIHTAPIRIVLRHVVVTRIPASVPQNQPCRSRNRHPVSRVCFRPEFAAILARRAVLVASVTSAFTTSPLRFRMTM